jgi:serine O-acetyltransferase
MKEIIYLIKSDLFRYVGLISLKSFFEAYFRFEGFRFTIWLRICQKVSKYRVLKYSIFPFIRLVYLHYKYKYGIDIPYQIEIGPGLRIFHFGGIIVSAKKIGRNFTISQNVTIGMRYYGKIKKFPCIGDNVYIAPGAAVIGGIAIGNNVAIGTNSVLLTDVKDNSVCVGIPSKVISSNGAGCYVCFPFNKQ